MRPIAGTLYRLVESQEQIATTGYVDTLDEQAVLEALLESSKPDYCQEDTTELHYLLKTPFRYPPLHWGSRFGRTHEPSLFYGGESLHATLSESAYYRLAFLLSIDGEAPNHKLNTEHTLFTIGYKTNRGIQLQKPPFDSYTEKLTNRQDYRETQQLGSDMRASGVKAFQYLSARTTEPTTCAALFTPEAFTDKKPTGTEQWLCETTPHNVTFKAIGSSETYHYSVAQFEIGGVFPLPSEF